ncbi:MAG: BACON domain-containing carbohydrate-binding protein [Desulfatirhabdiaceae bacterium]
MYKSYVGTSPLQKLFRFTGISLFLSCFLMMNTNWAFGTTLGVTSNENNSYDTLRQAVMTAEDGDVISLGNETESMGYNTNSGTVGMLESLPDPPPIPNQPVLSVSPTVRTVTQAAGATSFSVTNTGTGTMNWTATVTSGSTWLRITSGASGTDTGTIACSFDANQQIAARTGKILVESAGASGSPVEVTVTQQASATKPVLSVDPVAQEVGPEAGEATVSVSNSGTGTLNWTARVISESSWLVITSGGTGVNEGAVICSVEANTEAVPRSATIWVESTDADNSPVEVTITQQAIPILSVEPAQLTLEQNATTGTLTVSNIGGGTINWTAEVVVGNRWLKIVSGGTGTDAGTIVFECDPNRRFFKRRALVQVTAVDVTGSPVKVKVSQAGRW